MASPDWKPQRRIRDSNALRLLKAQARECCLCGRTDRLHLHHILYRSHSGDDSEANIVCVCEAHHRALHAREREAWLALREHIHSERPDTERYLDAKLGRAGAAFYFERSVRTDLQH